MSPDTIFQRRRLLALLLVCAATTLAFMSAVGAADAPRTGPLSGAEMVAHYKEWARVNPEAVKIAPAVSVLCAAPTPAPAAIPDGGPHKDKFIAVYVNDAARHAMFEERSPQFPIGSIIVKEKLATADSTSPELLTVMVKREPGFNPASGDWEFMVLTGDGTRVEARGKLENCQSCHVAVKAQDYVFRNYLPQDAADRLASRGPSR